MKPLSAVFMTLAGSFMLGAAPAVAVNVVSEEEAKKRHRMPDWRSLASLPDDAALPALAAIRASGLAEAMPMLGLDGRPIEITLRGYTAGRRATLEVRSTDRRIAVKAYAESPDSEARLYTTLDGGCGGVRVPRLVGWDRDLRVIAIEWLEGPPLTNTIRDGEGRRAGELAATWLRRAVDLPVRFGPPVGADSLLEKALRWADDLGAAEAELGRIASAVARRLAATPPPERAPHLVHGSLYGRHILDMGDGPGLIDWDCFGQGAAELDAAVFLSATWRMGLRPQRREACAQAIEAFLACARGLLDHSALAWYRAVTMLRLAHKKTHRSDDDALGAARPLLAEAGRLVATAT